jgi:hypothetical protein
MDLNDQEGLNNLFRMLISDNSADYDLAISILNNQKWEGDSFQVTDFVNRLARIYWKPGHGMMDLFWTIPDDVRPHMLGMWEPDWNKQLNIIFYKTDGNDNNC